MSQPVKIDYLILCYHQETLPKVAYTQIFRAGFETVEPVIKDLLFNAQGYNNFLHEKLKEHKIIVNDNDVEVAAQVLHSLTDGHANTIKSFLYREIEGWNRNR
jgi:hypothetical protein